VAVRYDGAPRARNDFDGFHWRETEDGRPWIGTSVQGLGAHVWWPCKASFYHPEDKPERVSVNATVPRGLVAVSNGRLTGRHPAGEDHETFHWRHPYPLETYAVTLNVAPYVALEGTLVLPGLEAPVPYAWYVLPASRERALVQFAQVPEILATFSEAFGPWPFPDAKVGLVQTSFWGMEHSTAVAYGSSFPAWIAEHGGKDRYASRNRWFDYILVHELAHEWWGNAVSAADWGDFWLHEGFATYAGGVYVERRDGRETADRFFAEQAAWVHPKAVLYRGAGTSSKQAFSAAIYSKGACVLNTLRHYLDDDETWWELLRTFQLRHRYGNATTEDLRAVLEELSGRDWSGFFDQWVHGAGYPRLSGRVRAQDGGVLVELEKPASPTGCVVPLDLAWREGDRRVTRRLWFGPGAHRERIACELPPTEIEVRHLERLLGEHDVRVDRRGER
jgi:aminopeptidase N